VYSFSLHIDTTELEVPLGFFAVLSTPLIGTNIRSKISFSVKMH